MKIASGTKIIKIILLAGTLILLFGVYFGKSSLSRGDAPYLPHDTLVQYLQSEPQAFTVRGVSLGGQNKFIWIWPYMALIAFLERILSIDPQYINKIFFYFPSLFLSILGFSILQKKLLYSKELSFLGAIFVCANSYYLLIIDGGQVGVALAYGLFPFSLIGLVSVVKDKFSIISTIKNIFPVIAIFAIDPRVGFLSVFTSLFFVEFRNIWKVAVFLFWLLAIFSYFIYPALTLGGISLDSSFIAGLSLSNGLFMFAPNWPENMYGVYGFPSIFFLIYPVVLLLSMGTKLSNKKSILSIIFISIFLIKGTGEPLGLIYRSLLSLPFGSLYRDSTKLFIPYIFMFSLLLAAIEVKLAKKRSFILYIAVYLLLLLPLARALTGKMNFVLSGNESNSNIELINSSLKPDGRTLWLPEKDSRGKEDSAHEVINGRDLTNFRPFQKINIGPFDRYNFLQNQTSNWWLDIFGIDSLVLSGNHRIVGTKKEEEENWQRLISAVNSSNFLSKTENTNVFKNDNYLPKFFSHNKLFVVIGSDNIYEDIYSKNQKFNPAITPFVFTEHGDWNPYALYDYAPDSLQFLLAANASVDQLVHSLLKVKFLGPSDNSNSEFAVYSPRDRITSDYELLIRKIDNSFLDFSKGVALSTKEGEKLTFTKKTERGGKYYLFVRSLSLDENGRGLDVFVDDLRVGTTTRSGKMTWSKFDVDLYENGRSNTHIIKLENSNTTSVFNALYLIESGEFKKVEDKAKYLIDKFGLIDTREFVSNIKEQSMEPVVYEKLSETRYKLSPSKSAKWITFSYSYDPKWKISRDGLTFESFPFYSALNGFYKRKEWDNMILEYEGQKNVRWGMYLSLVALLFVGLVISFTILRRYESSIIKNTKN